MHEGLWRNNVALVQLLGLCPTLAVTSNMVNGLGMGIATTFVLLGSNILISLLRNVIRPDVRIPAYVLVIASLVTVTDLAMNAYLPALHKVLGIFIPLIVVNCLVIGRAEAFASKHGPAAAAVDGVAMGLGFTGALAALGGLRELLGNGTLFSQAHLMFGDGARDLMFRLDSDFQGMLLAILPPGAFLGLGFLIAIKNLIDQRAARKAPATAPAQAQPAAG